MKLLHTSDWHLGATLGRFDRTPDHLVALRGLLELARSEGPDLILHTGDLFDGARPPYPAMELAVRALRQLSEVAPTVVLCGNHDSARLFRVLHDLAGVAAERRLWLVHEPQVVTFDLAGTATAVACIPFLRPGTVVSYADTPISSFTASYADGVRDLTGALLDDAGDRGEVVLLAAHLHLDGARPGRSERKITIGDDYATGTSGLDRTAYAAFGHIHDAQLIPGRTATGRYAGSLIPIDFGEVEQTKSAVTVAIDRDVVVETHALPGGRPLTRFAGGLDDLLDRAAGGALDGHLLKARVSSDDPIPDLADQVLAASPGCCIFDLVNEVANRKVRLAEEASAEHDEDLASLFLEWRQTKATSAQRTAPDDDVAAMLAVALDAGDSGLPVAEVEQQARRALEPAP